jgi:hypothetical protein
VLPPPEQHMEREERRVCVRACKYTRALDGDTRRQKKKGTHKHTHTHEQGCSQQSMSEGGFGVWGLGFGVWGQETHVAFPVPA